MDKKIYGYCRISTPYQNMERQVRNIKSAYPSSIIVQEVYTGTDFQNRDKLKRIISRVKDGDMIVFDSVSRMSRNAEDGYELYMSLFNKGIELVFLKEPYINTSVYRQALESNIALTGTTVDYVLEGLHKYLMALAQEQIKLAFEQAEKEVLDLRQRTKEGIETARLNGKQIGQVQGSKLNIKKAAPAKAIIRKHNKSFGGSLSNEETWVLAKISKATFYKYKAELERELLQS